MAKKEPILLSNIDHKVLVPQQDILSFKQMKTNGLFKLQVQHPCSKRKTNKPTTRRKTKGKNREIYIYKISKEIYIYVLSCQQQK